MTVAELIEALRRFPAELTVLVDWPSQMYGDSDLGDFTLELGKTDRSSLLDPPDSGQPCVIIR